MLKAFSVFELEYDESGYFEFNSRIKESALFDERCPELLLPIFLNCPYLGVNGKRKSETGSYALERLRLGFVLRVR
jgi:hypothetical protein